MYGNLKVFAGETAFNDYAHHLRELGEPIQPRSGLLWIFAWAAGAACWPTCTRRSSSGAERRRPAADQALPQHRAGPGYSGPTPVHPALGRIVIALFEPPPDVPDLEHRRPRWSAPEPSDRVVNGFRIWWVVVVYTVAMIAVGFHLRQA